MCQFKHHSNFHCFSGADLSLAHISSQTRCHVSSSSPQLMNTQPEKAFIRNKAAQVFALTFVMEYMTLWPKFFFDILSLVGLNPHGVDIYLRTLMAIDAEVVDRDILHTPEVRKRIMMGKLLVVFYICC